MGIRFLNWLVWGRKRTGSFPVGGLKSCHSVTQDFGDSVATESVHTAWKRSSDLTSHRASAASEKTDKLLSQVCNILRLALPNDADLPAEFT